MSTNARMHPTDEKEAGLSEGRLGWLVQASVGKSDTRPVVTGGRLRAVEQALGHQMKPDEILEIADRQTGQTYKIRKRRTTVVNAEVSERWVINVAVPPSLLEDLIQAEFLEPEQVMTEYGPAYVLALCAIFMRHAGPSWAPLFATPASHNLALRVACRDQRTGEPAVWVDHRYSDSCLAAALSWLGFPPVFVGLRCKRPDTPHGKGLVLQTEDHAIDLQIKPNHPVDLNRGGCDGDGGSGSGSGGGGCGLFQTVDRFSTCFGAGVRSYGPGAEKDTLTVVDLHKRSSNTFEHMNGWGGTLKALGFTWESASVYRTKNGVYRWIDRGVVGLDGLPINRRARQALGEDGLGGF